MILNMQSLYKHSLLTIVSLLIITSFFSCEKEDNLKPIIEISQPKLSVYAVLDTINVALQVSDNHNIERVSLYIIDANNQKVCTSYNYVPNSSTYNLKALYIIDNLYLDDGEYFFVIEASDGINIEKKYVSIQIGALPKKLNDILIAESDILESKIYSIKNGKQLFKTFSAEYRDFIYNPFQEQYQFLSKDGLLTSYRANKIDEQVWRVNDLKDPTHDFFGSLQYFDKNTLVSSSSGEIRYYDKDGNIINKAISNSQNNQIKQYYYNFDKIMLIKEPFINGEDKIEKLNQTTGASIVTYNILFKPEKLLFVDEGLCVIFGNKNNIAKACSLLTVQNVVHYFGDFGNRQLGDAYKYSKYLYLLSIDHQIVEYNITNGDERVIANTSNLVKFYYEELSHRLYFLDGKNIYYLNYPTDGKELYYANSKTVQDLIFVYNK